MADDEIRQWRPEPDPRPGDELDAKSRERIGKMLKAHYDRLANSPVPDRLLALLNQLAIDERSDDEEDWR